MRREKNKIKRRPDSSNKQESSSQSFQFLNTIYEKPKYYEEDKKYHDRLTLVYKNEDTGEKKIREIIDPTITYYVLKPEVAEQYDYPLEAVKLEDTDTRVCKYKDILLDSAKAIGEEDLYYKYLKARNFGAQKNLAYKNGLTFGNDINIEDFNIRLFLNKYQSKKNILTKAYYDIEVDTKDYKGFPDEHEAPCPINAITLVNDSDMSVHTYLLRNKSNPLIKKLEKTQKTFLKKVKERFLDDFGDLNYNLYFFDDELDLIIAFFNKINELKPDFASAWNAKFDMMTILNRLSLEYEVNPSNVICHPDFDSNLCYFYEDKKHQKSSEKGDFFQCSSYTIYTDGLINYATIRKGLGEKRSYSLNAICSEEIGQMKESYEDEGTLSDLPYINYEKFVIYNIKDVLLMKKLEDKINDIDLLYQIGLITKTRFNKAMKKTVSLANMRQDEFLKKGLIGSNNLNTNYLQDSSSNQDSDIIMNSPTTDNIDISSGKFEGAIVCDPNLNSNTGKLINGKKNKYIYENVIDFDLSSLYPSIILAFNIDTSTQHGRLIIKPDKNNFILNDKNQQDIAGEFMDDLNTEDYLSIASKWFNLPSVFDIADKLKNGFEIESNGKKKSIKPLI